jgi:hypothetical protein
MKIGTDEFEKRIEQMRIMDSYSKDKLLRLISEKQAKNKKIKNRQRNKQARRARAKNR